MQSDVQIETYATDLTDWDPSITSVGFRVVVPNGVVGPKGPLCHFIDSPGPECDAQPPRGRKAASETLDMKCSTETSKCRDDQAAASFHILEAAAALPLPTVQAPVRGYGLSLADCHRQGFLTRAAGRRISPANFREDLWRNLARRAAREAQQLHVLVWERVTAHRRRALRSTRKWHVFAGAARSAPSLRVSATNAR